MTSLASLKLVTAKKPNKSPAVGRRNKLCTKLIEQIKLATATINGETYSPTRLKAVTNAEGNRVQVAQPKRIKPWWFTDGVKYLADHAHCYWLLILYASHLASVNGEADSFTVLKLVRQGSGADIAIEDGNDQVLAAQHVEYTDFPFNSFSLFACWNGEYWIAMLVSEY